MTSFMIVCTVTGQKVSTGIRINGMAWNKDAEFYSFSRCPACGRDHEWSARDVTLEAEPAARLTAVLLQTVADGAASYAEFSR
ncbi:MAG TPA: hypothetical protein VH684_09680 [Xanthobacteraceae bacterium]|jgi:hypothetical protein